MGTVEINDGLTPALEEQITERLERGQQTEQCGCICLDVFPTASQNAACVRQRQGTGGNPELVHRVVSTQPPRRSRAV